MARLILAILAASVAAAQTPDFATRILEDSTGNPLPSAEIRFHKAGLRELAADLETDRAGRAIATGLAPGDYTVDIVKPNFVTASLKLSIPAASFTIRLVRHGVITGRISDQSGQPVPAAIHAPYGKVIGGTRIAILSRDPDGRLRLLRETAPAPDGRYRIFDLTPGQYAIGVWYDGLKDGSGVQLYPDNAHPRMFSVSGGEEYDHVDFVIAPQPVFQLCGRVETTNQKDTYNLALSLPDQPLLPIAQTLSEEGGAFKFDKIPAGVYDLLTGGPNAGYSQHTTSVPPNATYARQRISVGQNMDNLSIQLVPGRPLAIAVHAPESCAATITATVEPLDAWGISLDTRTAAVAPKQPARIENLPLGRFRIAATGLPPNCYQANAPIADLAATPEPVTIELAPAGSIRGTLHAQTPADYTILLLDDSAAQFARPDPQGRFAFDSLHPGRYRIAAQTGNSRIVADVAKMVEIQIPAGAPTEVNLRP